MKKQDLEALLREEVLEPYREELIKLIRPAIRMRTHPIREEDIKIGTSKIGGLPDLPSHLQWSYSQYNKEPLWFVSQINLSEVKPFDLEDLLPKEGMLYFFARYDECKVFYYKGDYGLLQRAIPPGQLVPPKQSFWQKLFKKRERMLFESCSLQFSTEYTHPNWDSYYLDRLKLLLKTDKNPLEMFSDRLWDKYFQLTGEKETASRHQLLGFARGIQHEYFEEYKDMPKDPATLQLPDYDKLLRYILLFQLDSDSNSKMYWGDWGRLYFMIEKDKLKEADFSGVYMDMQCY